MNTQAPDIEVLPPQTPMPESPAAAIGASSAPAPSRCQHRYANGKRCRQSGLVSQAGLCSHHFRLSNPAIAFPSVPIDSADLSEDLLSGLSHFSSAEDLREFLTRLLMLMTKGRVSPRRASVLAYITNQLLHSHRVVLKEEELDNESQPIIFDLPRPKCD